MKQQVWLESWESLFSKRNMSYNGMADPCRCSPSASCGAIRIPRCVLECWFEICNFSDSIKFVKKKFNLSSRRGHFFMLCNRSIDFRKRCGCSCKRSTGFRKGSSASTEPSFEQENNPKSSGEYRNSNHAASRERRSCTPASTFAFLILIWNSYFFSAIIQKFRRKQNSKF